MKARALKSSFTMTELFIMAFMMMFIFALNPAHAQAPQDSVPGGPADLILKVSSPKGTYIQFAQQIAQVCSKPSLRIETSEGQLKLYTDLVNNKANLGFLTAPILFGKKDIEKDINVDKIVVVMPMYAAEFHTVTLRSNGQLNAFTDVGNKKIGTYGGAFITGRILLAQAQIRPFSYSDYKTEDLVLAALQKGEIDVVFIEAGAPATWAENLDGRTYKLVPFNLPNLLGRNGFVKASLSYSNLSQTAVETLATQVYMVSRNYTGKEMVDNISALKNCIQQNLTTLREKTGFHPKWEEVKSDGKSDWPMLKTSNATSKPQTKKK
jgi:TRAP-type uncharacterized transport system substrate-binding protein